MGKGRGNRPEVMSLTSGFGDLGLGARKTPHRREREERTGSTWWVADDSAWVLGPAATLTLPSPSMERVRTGSPRVGCTRALVVWDVAWPEDAHPSPFQEETCGQSRGWLPGRPLTEFGRRRPSLPLPLERVKSGVPCS